MRVKSEKKSSKGKSLYLKLTLLFLGVVVGLFLAEISLRFLCARKIITLDNSIQTDTRIFSATRNYTHKPFSNRVNQLEETRTSWFINSLGFRDGEYSFKKPENTLRVLALGDSLTFGLGVEGSESFPKILETGLNKNSGLDKFYEVFNMGILGYGPIEYLNTYLEAGRAFKPDIILVGFFLGNDSLDSLWFNINKKAIFLKALPDRIVPYSINEFLKNHSSLWIFLLQKYYVWVETQSVDNIKLVFQNNVKGHMLYDVQIDPSNKYMQRSWSLTEQALNKLVNIARKSNTETMVLLLPTKEQIIPNEWEKAKSGGHNVDERLYSDSAPRKIMLSLCQKNNWYCLDLQDQLRNQNDLQGLFVSDDFHLSKRGNEVLSNLIFDYLLRNNLIEYQRR